MSRETNNIEGYKLAYSSYVALKGNLHGIFAWLIPGILASMALSVKDSDIGNFFSDKLPFVLFTIIFVTTIVSLYDYRLNTRIFDLMKRIEGFEKALGISPSLPEPTEEVWERGLSASFIFYQGFFCVIPFGILYYNFLKQPSLKKFLFIFIACSTFPAVRFYQQTSISRTSNMVFWRRYRTWSWIVLILAIVFVVIAISSLVLKVVLPKVIRLIDLLCR